MNQDNVNALAQTFVHGPYEFKFGRGAQRIIEGKSWINGAAEAKNARRLPK